MREKIAEKLYSILYNNPSKHNMKEFSRHLADQILFLPVEGFEVKVQTSDHPNGYAIETRPLTLGELPEQARKMREALIHIKEYWNEHDNVRAVTDALYEIQNTANDALTFKDK